MQWCSATVRRRPWLGPRIPWRSAPRTAGIWRSGNEAKCRSGTGRRSRARAYLSRDTNRDQRGVQPRRAAPGVRATGGGSVKLWDAEQGTQPLRLHQASRRSPPVARWRSARTAAGWPRPASAAAWTCGIRRPASSTQLPHSGTSLCVAFSPDGRASPRPAKTRRCISGTRRPAGKCSAFAGTPTSAGAWRSAPTASAWPRPAWTGRSASGTRRRCWATNARKS